MDVHEMTLEQKNQIRDYLRAFFKEYKSHKNQYWASYSYWNCAHVQWSAFSGGTDTMRALVWYQHYHKPGSKEWQPNIILQAVLDCIALQGETRPKE